MPVSVYPVYWQSIDPSVNAIEKKSRQNGRCVILSSLAFCSSLLTFAAVIWAFHVTRLLKLRTCNTNEKKIIILWYFDEWAVNMNEIKICRFSHIDRVVSPSCWRKVFWPARMYGNCNKSPIKICDCMSS